MMPTGSEWQNRVFWLLTQCTVPCKHRCIYTYAAWSHNLYFYCMFYFWSSYLTQCKNILLVSKFTVLIRTILPKSFGPYLFIFKLYDYILPASENSITVCKTINRPPIDSSKTIIEKKILSPIKHVYGNKCNPFLAQMHKFKLLRKNLKDFLKSIHVH